MDVIVKMPISIELGQVKDSKSHFNPKENMCAVVLTGPKDKDRLYAYAVALRRTLLEETPYVAMEPTNVDQSRISVNTSRFNDEYIRLRLALVPLSLKPARVERIATRPDKYQWKNGTIPQCTLDVSATGQETYDIVPVTSRDVTTTSPDVSIRPDPVTDHYALLAKLLPGQRLKVDIEVTVNTGRSHAAYSALGTVSYEIDDTTSTATDKILMVVEANNGGLPDATQHVYDALYWAKHRLQDFRSKLNDEHLQIRVDSTEDTFNVILILPDETETRATVVTNELRHTYMDTKTPRLLFAGHRTLHPLEHNIEFKLQPTKHERSHHIRSSEQTDIITWARTIMREATQQGILTYETMLQTWSKLTNTHYTPTIPDKWHVEPRTNTS